MSEGGTGTDILGVVELLDNASDLPSPQSGVPPRFAMVSEGGHGVVTVPKEGLPELNEVAP